MEILERLFGLLVNRIPAGFAEGLLCFLYFVFRPYRAVLRMVRFARQNNVSSRLLVAFAALLFLLASGFSHPLTVRFNPSDVAKHLTQLWSAGSKVDALYVVVCMFGLTVLVLFVEQCLELFISMRHRRLFRDFYYVAVALTILWWAAAVVSFFNLVLPGSLNFSRGLLVWSLLCVCISFVSPLVFVIQFERRWYPLHTLRARLLRIAPIYGSILAILIVVPPYLSYLGSVFYSRGTNYASACFARNGVLYAAVGAENPDQAIGFLSEFYLSATVRVIFLKKFVLRVTNQTLFDALKEDAVIKPGETRRFRLKISPSKNFSWELEDRAVLCGISATKPSEPPAFFETRVDVPDGDVEVEVLPGRRAD